MNTTDWFLISVLAATSSELGIRCSLSLANYRHALSLVTNFESASAGMPHEKASHFISRAFLQGSFCLVGLLGLAMLTL